MSHVVGSCLLLIPFGVGEAFLCLVQLRGECGLLYHLSDSMLCPGRLRNSEICGDQCNHFPRWANESNTHLFSKWPEIWNWTFTCQKTFSWSLRPCLDHNTKCAEFNPSTVRIILGDSKGKWQNSKGRWIEPVKIETLQCSWEIGWSGWGKRLLF